MELQKNYSKKGLLAEFLRGPFVCAVALLTAGAVINGPVASWMDVKKAKRPLPLKKPLAALDVDALRPYRVRDRQTLDPVMVEALGTDRYLAWALEDPLKPANDPLRYPNLMVTYYSGGHNLVPHTPDVCYYGAGYQPAQPHENREFHIPGIGTDGLPVRVLTFIRTAVFNRDKTSVVYTFYCNGKFVCTRSGVRFLINDLGNTYAYFAKIEVSFRGATREQCMAGTQKLFAKLLPVLLRDHFPDFEAAERAAATPQAPG